MFAFLIVSEFLDFYETYPVATVFYLNSGSNHRIFRSQYRLFFPAFKVISSNTKPDKQNNCYCVHTVCHFILNTISIDIMLKINFITKQLWDTGTA